MIDATWDDRYYKLISQTLLLFKEPQYLLFSTYYLCDDFRSYLKSIT